MEKITCKKCSHEFEAEHELARMVFCDPPYSIDYSSSGGLTYNSEKFGGTGGRIFNDDKSPAEALEFY